MTINQDTYTFYDDAIFELLKFLHLPGYAASRRREEYEMSWQALEPTWSDRYNQTVERFNNTQDNASKRDIIGAYNLLLACFGAVKESTPPAFIQRITVHGKPYDPLQSGAARRHGLDSTAQLIEDEAIWAGLNELVHAVGKADGASATSDVPGAASDSATDTGHSVSDNSDSADSVDPAAEDTVFRGSATVDEQGEQSNEIVDPLGDGAIDDAPVVPAIDDKQARIVDKQKRHREFVKREYAKFTRGDVDADHMWAVASGGSVEENTGGTLMRVQVEDDLKVDSTVYAYGTDSDASIRVNRALMERAETIIVERMRQRGFDVSSKRGKISRPVLLNMMLLDVIGDDTGVTLSHGNALVRAALNASDRRVDELQEQVGQLGDQLDELSREMRRANARSVHVHEEVLINQNLSAVSLGDRLSAVVRPGAGVEGVNIEEPFVRALVKRVREETRQLIQRQYEQEHRQDSADIR